jgi:cysteinyl-tRNA synthetase
MRARVTRVAEVLALAGCGAATNEPPASQSTNNAIDGVTTPTATPDLARSARERCLWSNIASFHFQLQAVSTDSLADAALDLVIIDPCIATGDPAASPAQPSRRFTAAQIARIRDSGKWVVAYLSIGEAENYRDYWKPIWSTEPPAWLGPENPDWPGNYKVRFDDPAWQAIVFDEIDRIVAQGFDGLYLDIVDAYWFWGSHDAAGVNAMDPADPAQVNAWADKMIVFIEAVRQRARRGTTQLKVVPQNASWLPHDCTAAMASRYHAASDAIGAEDVFFNDDEPVPVDDAPLANLRRFRANRKPVFVIDYPLNLDNQALFKQKLLEHGFAGTALTRALDQPPR